MNESSVWWVALSKSLDEGTAALVLSANSGAWRQDPRGWIDALTLLRREPEAFIKPLTALVTSICESTLDSSAEAVLPVVFSYCVQLNDKGLVRQIVAWLVPHIGPGKAAHVIEILDRVRWNRSGEDEEKDVFPKCIMGLVERLVDVGPAELRMRQHPRKWNPHSESARDRVHLSANDLIWIIARTLHFYGDSKRLPAAVHYLVSADLSTTSFQASINENVWALTEAAIVAGLSRSVASDVTRLLSKSRWTNMNLRWRPLLSEEFPECGAALARALTNRSFSSHAEREGFEVLVSRVAYIPNRLDERVAIRVLNCVKHWSNFPGTFDGPNSPVPDEAALAAWAKLSASSVSQWYLSTDDRRVHRSIERALTWSRPSLLPSMIDGMRDGGGPAASAIDARLPANEAHLRALLATFDASQRIHKPGRTLDDDTKSDVLRAMHRLLSKDLRPVRGVDLFSILSEVDRVEFAVLPNKRKVEVSDGILTVSERDIPLPTGNALWPQAAIVYIVHELVHMAQGFDEMPTVQTARSIGAENVIAYVDLEADHVTALLLADGFPEWTLVGLKDQTGRGLEAFPVNEGHTAAARQRKASRLVSSRFDLAIRRTGAVTESEIRDAFFFLDFAPSGSHCLAFSSGPPLCLIAGPLLISEADRNHLMCAADGDDEMGALHEVDRVVTTLAEDIRNTRRARS